MKAKGVDYSSKSRMIKLHETGYTPEEISREIQVEQKCVEGWIKALYPEKPKPKPKKKAEED